MKKLIQSKDIHTLDENKVLELDSLPVSTKLSLKRIIQRPKGNPDEASGKEDPSETHLISHASMVDATKFGLDTWKFSVAAPYSYLFLYSTQSIVATSIV